MLQARDEKGSMLAEVNRNILEAARESVADEEQLWEFFCECGDDDCHAHVLLRLPDYVALRDGGGAVLAEGHEVNQVERARRLGADAQALRHQAEHQLRRATRNVPPAT